MTTAVEAQETPSRENVPHMFDRIAKRYDFLNRLLSMRQDVAWRRKLAKMLPAGENLRLIDLATGTGDQIIFLLSRTKQIGQAIGMDLSEGMLEVGREKIAKLGLNDQVELKTGDANIVPADDSSFDVLTMSFGIRNVLDVSQTMRNMHRVLKPGGRALILEFSLPNNGLIRKSYLFYFRHVLPRIGGALSGDHYAYNYLNKTVETFPYGDEFCGLMKDAGFENVKAHPVTFGIATIYQADKVS